MASISFYNQQTFQIILQFISDLSKGLYHSQYENEVVKANNLINALGYVGITEAQTTIIKNELNTLLRNITVNMTWTANGLFSSFMNNTV